MLYPAPLVPAVLIRRYKRFLADIRFADGTESIAHCANPGSMLGLAEPGAPLWLLPVAGAGRKLSWSWELVGCGGHLVGVNTGHANRLAEEAIRGGIVAALAGYPGLRREVPYGLASRVDFLLEAPGRPPAYVEVKSVTLSREAGLAEFPDAKTARGARHLDELAGMARSGARAVMLYIVQRGDAGRFALAADIDPAYAANAAAARAAGVEMLCYGCDVDAQGIIVRHPLPLII